MLGLKRLFLDPVSVEFIERVSRGQSFWVDLKLDSVKPKS